MNTGRNSFEYWENPYMPSEATFANQYLTIIDAGRIDYDEWYLKLLYNKTDTIFYIPRYDIYEYRSI